MCALTNVVLEKHLRISIFMGVILKVPLYATKYYKRNYIKYRVPRT